MTHNQSTDAEAVHVTQADREAVKPIIAATGGKCWDDAGAVEAMALAYATARHRITQAGEAERLREALERMVYEATHLSPCKPNGDHDCTIKAEALAQARAALKEHRVGNSFGSCQLMEALGKVMPIRVNEGPDYAQVYFADGAKHSTQAMTMNPNDWRELSVAYDIALNQAGKP